MILGIMNLVVFSHSDYSFLWSVIEDYIKKIPQLNPVFVCNKNNLNNKPEGFCKYIEYDDRLCYAQRWIVDILPHIESKYILVVHDVAVILNCNVNKINNIVNIIDKHNIDRCCMIVFDGIEIIHDNDIYLCNLNNHVKSLIYTPYDVSPAIWNKSSYLKLWNMFPNETYRNSELNSNLQKYCRTLKCYGLQKTNDKIYYCLSRPYYELFKVLHITTKGEITFPIEVYMDTIQEFKEIVGKYNLNNKIKINPNYGYVLSCDKL